MLTNEHYYEREKFGSVFGFSASLSVGKDILFLSTVWLYIALDSRDSEFQLGYFTVLVDDTKEGSFIAQYGKERYYSLRVRKYFILMK